tara:strand:- start:4882 stop:5244 length:363 start_codon:yes stop_codon:yes gene_type:complete
MTEDIRLMLDMIEGVIRQGADPYLTDILTQDNIHEIEMVKRSIYFCSDIDKPDPESEIDFMVHDTLSGAEGWSVEYIRGLMMGILMSLDGQTRDVFANKEEMAILYRLLSSMIIERIIDE